MTRLSFHDMFRLEPQGYRLAETSGWGTHRPVEGQGSGRDGTRPAEGQKSSSATTFPV